ncbi:cytochrome P450 [Xylogone sp. PMI_703]|nr:cytochrome P450 [Xylogone sp. PMI_703]
MPYVKAFIQEVLRWRLITADGVPHSNTEDNTYMNFHILKDSIVMVNVWSMSLDLDLYNDPTQFKPERWIERSDLPSGSFGYGRRACPGQYFARMSLETMVPRLLWAFNFEHAIDDCSQPVTIDPDLLRQNGAVLKPMPFRATLRVRSPAEREVMMREYKAMEGIEKILNDAYRHFSSVSDLNLAET